MRNTKLTWVKFVIVSGTVGCGAPDAATSSFAVVDQQARDAGFAIEAAGTVSDAKLPLAFDASQRVSLVGPDTEESLEADPGELVYVHGENAEVTRLVIGQDVDADRVWVEGSREAADELALRLGGALRLDGDRWQLAAPDALAACAAESAPLGLLGIEPMAIDEANPTDFWEQMDAPAPGVDEPAPIAPGILEGIEVDDDMRPFVVAPGSRFAAVTGCPGVTGQWRARVYSVNHDQWYDFRLDISSGGGSWLVGRVDVDFWDGAPDDDTTPGACTGAFDRAQVSETARGRVLASGRLELDAVAWRVERRLCGEALGSYCLDRFAGAIDPTGTTFEATVSDDCTWIAGIPVTFTRVRCGG